MIRESLKEYIEGEVIGRYAAFDKAHREDHARMVIERALAMGKSYAINEELLYAAAACHDLGLAVDRKMHHLESGRIIRADARLKEWFTPEEIETIAMAAEDHRASATTPPRSIYGCLVFKWSDIQISTREVITAIGQEPLFGHRSGKKMNTHWMCYMKLVD